MSLPLKFDALFVVADHHGCEHIVAFSLRADFEMATAFLPLFEAKILGFNTILMIELSTLLKAVYTIVGVPLDVLKQAFGGLLVREKYVLDDVQSEYLLLQLLLVAVELLLLLGNLSSEHGLATPLLLTGEFPVLKLLDANL